MSSLCAPPLRLVAALLVCAVAACHSMRPLQPSQLQSKSIDRVWITKADSTLVVVNPQLRGDTLGGFVDGAYRELPLSEAHALRALEPAPARTALLVGTATAAAIAGFVYFENRSYVGSGEACGNEVMAQQQIDLHCGGPCPC